MTDIVDAATRSRMMSGIRSRNTQPELLVRRFLHAHGFRYRLHVRNLPGTPDLILPKWRTALFVHGCFWHRHEGCPFATTPKSRPDFWQHKFTQNVSRDDANMEALQTAGWHVLVIWECSLKPKQRDAALNELICHIRNGHQSNE